MSKENATVLAKKQMRAVLKERRASLSPTEQGAQSAQLCATSRDFWQNGSFSRAVVYLAAPGEANIDGFILWLLAQNVPLWAPRGDDFAPLYNLDEVETGRFGVREPWVNGSVQETTGRLTGEQTVFFIPGLAFDQYGGRLGFGGGWYDRALARFPQALKIGVAFTCQMVPLVPYEAHDVKMDWVVTPALVLPVAGVPVGREGQETASGTDS
jgi:5-formyltetrahydrofolate cyclo-ligase